MKYQINELVQRLSSKQPVECSRPEKTAKALKECIDREYVHIKFSEIGTEVAMQLYLDNCDLNQANFSEGSGIIRLVGCLKLNYNKVKCIIEIDLSNCEGEGLLEPVSDQEYDQMMSAKVE